MKKKNIIVIICVFVILIVATVGYYLGKQSHDSSITPIEEKTVENVQGQKNKERVVDHSNRITSLEGKTTENMDESKELEWVGINSRDEVLKKIDGTTWETVEKDKYTGRWLRFVIRGNSVKQYQAASTLNYDDPKEWHLFLQWEIEGAYEPEKDIYNVLLKEINGKYLPCAYIYFSKEHKDAVTFIWGDNFMQTRLRIVNN